MGSALAVAKEALQLARMREDYEEIAIALLQMANIHYRLGHLDELKILTAKFYLAALYYAQNHIHAEATWVTIQRF